MNEIPSIFAERIRHPQNSVWRNSLPAIRKRSIGRCQLKRGNLTAAQRQRQAIAPGIRGFAQRVNAKPPGYIEQRRYTNRVEQAHRRDI